MEICIIIDIWMKNEYYNSWDYGSSKNRFLCEVWCNDNDWYVLNLILVTFDMSGELRPVNFDLWTLKLYHEVYEEH